MTGKGDRCTTMAQTVKDSPWPCEGGVGSASMAEREWLLCKQSKVSREQSEDSRGVYPERIEVLMISELQ